MDAPDIRRNDMPRSIFNPLSHDFVAKLRNDANIEMEYKLPAMEISTFPAYLADRIIEDLVTAIRNERNMGFLTEEEKNKLVEEVKVNLNE